MSDASKPSQRRTDRKRADIIAAAERLFLEGGYGATSMDRIAAEAEASKRTVYNHFPSKEELFRAMVQGMYSNLHDAASGPAPGQPVADALTGFAQAILVHMGNARLKALIRLVIAENQRFPEIASIYFQAGKEPAVGRLSEWLAGETAAGRLSVAHPTLAAQQFLGCLKEALFWPGMLGLAPLHPPELVVSEAVAAFLARYR